ncbi:MAG: hypothetical protein RI947_736 [Candidatus Parcubacteria bacterium]|jgi:hypothetical protein
MSIKNQLTVYAAFIAVFISYVVFMPYSVLAATSVRIQGKLALRQRGSVNPKSLRLKLALYTDDESAQALWTERYDSSGTCAPVPVQKNGTYKIHLGSCVEPAAILFENESWLQIDIRDGTTWKSSNRIPLSSSSRTSRITIERTSPVPSLRDQLRSGALKLRSDSSETDTSALAGHIVGKNSKATELTINKEFPYSIKIVSADVTGTVLVKEQPAEDSSFIFGDINDLTRHLQTTAPASNIALLGTENQVIVSQSDSTYTLSLPQNLHAGASLNISGLKISKLGGILKAADGTVSGAAGIDDLAGVDISTATNGQLLRYNGSDEEWQNWTPDIVSLTGLSATAPLTYNSSSGAYGLSYNATNLIVSSNKLDTIQNIDTASAPTFAGLTSTGRIFLTTTGDSGYLSSSGGALRIDLTNDIGSGIGIYSDAGASALGNMINVKVDNAAYAQAAFYMNYDGSSNAVEIVSNSTDTSSNALSITGNNPNDSTLGVIGYETGKGSIKVTHNGTGSDSNASALSIDLAGTGTRAQGVYVDSTAATGTLGNLLRLRNQTVDKFVVNYQGNLGMAGDLTIGANGTNTTITKYGNTAGDEFFVGTNGAFRVQRSATNSETFRVQINGDTQGRWLGTSDGKLKWGDGSNAQDITLQRGAAGLLWLDGGMVINNSNGSYNTIVKGVSDSNLFFVNGTANSIGIGTSTQGSKLDIADSGNGVVHGLRLQNTVAAANNSASDILFAAKRLTTGTTNIASISGMITDVTQNAFKGALIFSTANNSGPAERMRIDNIGNVGVGTNNPQYLLQVRIDASNEGHVTSTGAWANTSDLRFKKNIEDLTDGLSKVMSLRPVSYDTLTAPDRIEAGLHIGFIAQEVEKIVPEVVDTDSNGFKSLTYGQFTPLLVSAIQQQQLSLAQTSKRLTGIEDRISPPVPLPDVYGTRLDTLEKQLTDLQLLFDTDHAQDPHSLSDITIQNLITQHALVIEGSAVFKGSTVFEGPVTFNSDSGGYAKIKQGANKVQITFEHPYEQIPIISVTSKSSSVVYEVTDESSTGFSILLQQPANKEQLFSWIALSVKNPKTYESTSSDSVTTEVVTPSPEITVTESPSVSPTLVPTSSPL